MTSNVPQELSEKLDIIKKESDFFSKSPRKLHFVSLITGFILIALSFVSLIFLNLKNHNLFNHIFPLALMFFLIGMLIEQKSLFNKSYSSACEIINYYKSKKDKSKNKDSNHAD